MLASTLVLYSLDKMRSQKWETRFEMSRTTGRSPEKWSRTLLYRQESQDHYLLLIHICTLYGH